jgi:pyruvate, water dikinase
MCRACPTVPELPLSTVSDASGSHAMSDRPTSPYISWFDEYTEDLRPRVGGKNASLGTMIGAGLPVPPGFAVTTDAYETLRSHPELQAAVHECLGGLDLDDSAKLRAASLEVRSWIEAIPLPDDVIASVRASYRALCTHCDTEGVPVAVRSSATAEDLPDASFAGQQDTYLWICGEEAVLEHVRRCWSSVFTDRAISYRRQTGHDHEQIDMSVGIQKMVDPTAAGVAFTLNPSNGDRSQIAIDAAWGFGEGVVSGEVTPDNFLVDKVLNQITRRSIGAKAMEYRRCESGVECAEVEPERAQLPCLTDDQVQAVAAMARRAEKHYGSPQDVEWALDRHLPDGDNVILLQSRPETVWSRRKRSSTPPTAGLESIVSTLIKPLAADKSATRP